MIRAPALDPLFIMLVVLLVIQILIALALIGAVLMQRSEGGALGMGGGGAGGLMTARGASNLLTRVTAVLATLFFLNCIALTVMGNFARGGSAAIDAEAVGSIDVDRLKAARAPAPATEPAAPTGQAAPSLGDLAAPLPEARQPAASSAPAPAPTQP